MADVNKAVRKRIGFNFYRGEIKKDPINIGWDASELFNHYIKNDSVPTAIEIEDELIEIEPHTLYKNDEGIYFFQLSNLRNDLIPAKKKIGKEKIDIELEEDEYIGEFTGVVYDSVNSVFMMQINKYGINIQKATKYLKSLREYYLKDIQGRKEIKEMELNLVIDEAKLKTLYKSQEIRKIVLKSSSTCLAVLDNIASEDEKKIIGEMNKAVSSFGNVNFEISISPNFKDSETLNKKSAKDIMNLVLKKINSKKDTKKEKLNLEITRRETEDSKVEVVDFLAPKMLEYINIRIEPKKSIGRDFLRVKMFEIYLNKRANLNRVLGL